MWALSSGKALSARFFVCLSLAISRSHSIRQSMSSFNHLVSMVLKCRYCVTDSNSCGTISETLRSLRSLLALRTQSGDLAIVATRNRRVCALHRLISIRSLTAPHEQHVHQPTDRPVTDKSSNQVNIEHEVSLGTRSR